MNDIQELTIAKSILGLRRGDFSSVEITHAFLKKIDQLNRTINAYITVDAEGALAAAKRADQRLQRGDAKPLTGIPVAHKDLFCTKGVATTCGSRMLSQFIAPYDATVTTRLKQMDAVILGKTNMDEFAMGSSTETSYFGVTRNPWDLERTPGGSSGGSAAAVSAGLCLAATGTDTGGSIRQPASLTGVVGIKPTYGRVSRFGMIAFASSLDQGGVFAKTVEDAAYLLQVMAGHDPKDATSIDAAVPDYPDLIHQKATLQNVRIGVPEEYFTRDLNPLVRQSLETALETFRQLGATTVSLSLPCTSYAIPTYYILAPAEASSNLARYDGVKYGHRSESTRDLHDMYCQTRSEGFGPEVKRRIMLGTYVLSAGYYDAYYRKAQRVRRLIADDFETAFKQVDLLVTPTSPTTAFKLGERVDDPVQMYLSDIFTISVNLAGLPALSLPCGMDDKGLPIGIQLISPPLTETKLFHAGHLYQQATDWHTKQPEMTE